MKEFNGLQKLIGKTFDGLEIKDDKPAARDLLKPFTQWFDEEIKKKYDELQDWTDKDFGKKMKELNESAIKIVHERLSKKRIP